MNSIRPTQRGHSRRTSGTPERRAAPSAPQIFPWKPMAGPRERRVHGDDERLKCQAAWHVPGRGPDLREAGCRSELLGPVDQVDPPDFTSRIEDPNPVPAWPQIPTPVVGQRAVGHDLDLLDRADRDDPAIRRDQTEPDPEVGRGSPRSSSGAGRRSATSAAPGRRGNRWRVEPTHHARPPPRDSLRSEYEQRANQRSPSAKAMKAYTRQSKFCSSR